MEITTGAGGGTGRGATTILFTETATVFPFTAWSKSTVVVPGTSPLIELLAALTVPGQPA